MIEIIDLDEPEFASIVESEGWKELHMALSILYFTGSITNSSLITMQVWIGLRSPIPDRKQKHYIPLAMKIASMQANESSLSFLVGTAMIMEDVKRYYTLDDQKILLNKLIEQEKRNGNATVY